MSFSDLSPDIQKRILKYLSNVSYREVNRTWCQMITEQLTEISLSGDFVTESLDLFPKISTLNLMGKVSHIDLSNRPKIQTVRLIEFQSCVDFLEESFCQTIVWDGGNKCSSWCLEKLFQNLSRNSQIKNLTLVNKRGWCQKCLPLYGQIRSLEKLEIFFGENMCYQQLQHLSGLPSLTHLSLYQCEFAPELYCQPNLIGCFRSFPSLQKLEISEETISDQQLRKLKKCSFQVISYLEESEEFYEFQELEDFEDEMEFWYQEEWENLPFHQMDEIPPPPPPIPQDSISNSEIVYWPDLENWEDLNFPEWPRKNQNTRTSQNLF